MKNDMAYKGYIIRAGLIGDYFIGKDNYWVICVKSIEEAKKEVDKIVD
jgi:hypothetical protein